MCRIPKGLGLLQKSYVHMALLQKKSPTFVCPFCKGQISKLWWSKYTLTHTHADAHAHAHTHTHTRIHTYTHTQSHAHTNAPHTWSEWSKDESDDSIYSCNALIDVYMYIYIEKTRWRNVHSLYFIQKPDWFCVHTYIYVYVCIYIYIFNPLICAANRVERPERLNSLWSTNRLLSLSNTHR